MSVCVCVLAKDKLEQKKNNGNDVNMENVNDATEAGHRPSNTHNTLATFIVVL